MRSLLWLLICLCPGLAGAHAGSRSWLAWQVDGAQLRGTLTASQVDMALALGLDIREPPAVLAPQLDARRADVLAYVRQGLVVLLNGERQPLDIGGITTEARNGEQVLVLPLASSAPSRIDALDVGYTLFFEDDVLHEALVRFEWDGGAPSERVFRLGEPLQHAERADGAASGFLDLLRSGIWHIWTGYDHVLFLLALLLPAVLIRARHGWAAAAHLRPALLRALAVVTAFTVAHSVTLAGAALGVIVLPARIVEPAIALSVFIAAASNLLPNRAASGGPWMAFAFGLLHGFGFAGVLAGLMPEDGSAWRPLLAFNLGVEAGQLAIVAVFFPLAWWLRATPFYRVVLLRAGSVAVCVCALVWFIARTF